MVLCRFFQQGNCRYGTKCANEHIDVKQLVKADIESALNGKQWPLSCFGPFKDKPNVPNFINDQSFEELRLLCYEAKQKNYFDQFHQQFTKEVMDATNKMKTVLQFPPDVMEIITKIYDAPSEGSVGGVSTVSNSLFSKPAATNAVGGVGSNVFGGGFGATATNNAGSIFGGTTNNAQQNSLFGQQTANKPVNSIFGGGLQNQSNSIFGRNTAIANTTVTPLGGAIGAGGGNLFTQASQLQQQQQQPISGSGFGLFSQAAQQSAPLFGQQQPQQQQSSSIFGQQQPQQPGSNIFAQAVQHQQQPQTQNLFGQAAAQVPPTQVAPQANIFAQQQQQIQTAQQPPTGFFQQAMQHAPQTMQQQQPLQSLQLAAAAPTTNASINNATSVYSKMEDLTAEEIEAFKAGAFLPGKLPCSPPPRELVS